MSIIDIDLSKVMNDSNLNFILLQTMGKSIIVVDRFLMEKSTAVSLFVDVHIHFALYDFLFLFFIFFIQNVGQ
jgi:hypothetical protein